MTCQRCPKNLQPKRERIFASICGIKIKFIDWTAVDYGWGLLACHFLHSGINHMTLRSRMTQNIRRQDLGKLVSQELAGHSESFLTFAVFPRRPPQRGFMILNIDSAALRVAILLFRLSTIAFRQRLLPTSGSSDPTRVLTVWLATALTVAHWRAYMRCAHTQGTVARVSQF